MYRLLLLFLWTILNSAESAKFIPSYIQICKFDDPNLNVCFRDSFRNTINHLPNGIPEMNLRPIEPLAVDYFFFDYGNGSIISFQANLTNTTLHGLSAAKLEYSHIDLNKLIVEVALSIEEVYVHADFKGHGRVLILNYDTQGIFTANVSGIVANGTWWGKKVQKNGEEHATYQESAVDIDVKDMNIHFENLFPVEIINERANEVINENIFAIYEDVKPMIIDIIKAIIYDSLNNVYDTFPFQTLFPK